MSERSETTETPNQAAMNGATQPPFELRTPLAKKLWEIRQRIVASGRPLLDWNDVEREIAEQRGAPIEGEAC